MGGTSYSIDSRSVRSATLGYAATTVESIHKVFVQKTKGEAHESMRSQGIVLREARDSDVHPNTYPLILAMDMTGSMHDIPVMLIKDGLPKIVSQIIQRGVKDIAILFLAVGDHEVDGYPLQVGQFESGDLELDLWLTRTFPEGGGGANEGESYGLIHNFAANFCATDAWDKRKQKGTLIIIGDEPSLDHYPAAVMREITGNPQAVGFSQDEILEKVKERWNVFHINPHHSYDEDYWKPKLGQNYISLKDHNEIPETVTEIVCRFACTINEGDADESIHGTEQDKVEGENPSFIR